MTTQLLYKMVLNLSMCLCDICRNLENISYSTKTLSCKIVITMKKTNWRLFNVKSENRTYFRTIANLWIKKKETTYIHYYNLLKNHIEPRLGDEFIEDITLLKLEEIIISFSSAGKLNNKSRLLISK